MISGEVNMSDNLYQCFSTGVPRNPRVPQASAKGSAADLQQNDLACEITSDNVVEMLSVDFFLFEIAFLCVFLHRLTVLDHFCCQ